MSRLKECSFSSKTQLKLLEAENLNLAHKLEAAHQEKRRLEEEGKQIEANLKLEFEARFARLEQIRESSLNVLQSQDAEAAALHGKKTADLQAKVNVEKEKLGALSISIETVVTTQVKHLLKSRDWSTSTVPSLPVYAVCFVLGLLVPHVFS